MRLLGFSLSDFLQPRAIISSLIFVLMLLSLVLLSAPLQGLYIISSFALFIVFNRDLVELNGNERNFFLLLIFLCLLALPINAFRAPTVALHFLMMLAGIATALFVARDSRTYATASFIVLAFAQASVLGFLAVRGTDNFPLEEMVENASSNGITSYLVCLQINYCVASLRARGTTTLITAAITVYLCVVGYGRGSILASVAVLLVSLLFTFQFLRRDLAIAGTIILTAVVGFLLFRNFDQIYGFLEENTKIGSGLFDDARSAINAEYVASLNGFTLLFGGSYENLLIDRFYNGNPHNSYIRAHHLFGIGYPLAILFMATRAFFTDLPWSEKAFYSAMLAILLFRASTEPILFPTSLDALYFSIFLLLGRARTSAPKPVIQPAAA